MTNKIGFNYELGADGIAIVTMNMQGPVNLMNTDYLVFMSDALDRINTDIANIKGIVLTSAKSTFFAGGDIKAILKAKESQDWDSMFEFGQQIKAQMIQLETLGVPVVAAINGAAMGGGFELCLACHYRIALASASVGLPEVSLGLLPGAGGVVRSVRLLGLKNSFPLLIEGKPFKAQQAQEAGLIDEVATSSEDMLEKAKAWILANPEAQQPWLKKGYSIPNGNAYARPNAIMLAGTPAMIYKKTKGLLPAPEAIIAVMAESTMCGYQAAMNIESRYFSKLLKTPESTSLIKTLYLQMNEIDAGASRPSGEQHLIKKVGVLGAGMMGRGIAYATALTGMEVILKDLTVETAEAGKAYSKTILDKRIARGRMTADKGDEVLSRIHTTSSNEDLADCDLIIEAVFENLELKLQLCKETEPYLKDSCIWGSNTSTLPISLLAEGFSDPSRFIGVHFFSPVDKMQLVEIINGQQTSESTLAFVYDYVTKIRKKPIVVNDGRGFYTSRVFGCAVDEAIHLLTEGVDPIIMENVAKQAGMPVGMLAVMDEVDMGLMKKASKANIALDQKLGDNFHQTHTKMSDLAIEMCNIGRSGRACGKGWYDYHEDGSKSLWPELKQKYGADVALPVADIADRIMFRQVIETLTCIDSGVLKSARDANIGSIFGWGFPIHTGGTIQFIEWFGGKDKFEARRAELETKYGARFGLPKALDEIIESVL